MPRPDLDPTSVVELFAQSLGRPNVPRGGAVALALQSRDPRSATFDGDSIRKDLCTMIADGKTLGFALRLARQTLAVFDQASGEGWGGKHCTELPAFWSSAHRA